MNERGYWIKMGWVLVISAGLGYSLGLLTMEATRLYGLWTNAYN